MHRRIKRPQRQLLRKKCFMRNAITVTALFTAILSPVFLNDCITFFRYDRKRNCKPASRVCDRCRFFRTIKQWNLKQYHFQDCVLADRSYCYGDFIHNNRITDSWDWLSGRKNLPEILLGYYQHYGGNNEYRYRNLLRRMDKIYPSDKPHCTVTSGACGLYRNHMLCERLAGKTRTLLKINGQLKMTLSVL